MSREQSGATPSELADMLGNSWAAILQGTTRVLASEGSCSRLCLMKHLRVCSSNWFAINVGFPSC